MIWLRRLIIFLPVSLLAFFAIAFVSVRLTPPRKLNQLTVGSIGEAKILNPLLATTTADSDINELIFAGLIRYNEDIEVEGALAERWTITQTATLFFGCGDDAARAAAKLEAARDAWPAWGLAALRVTDARVALQLDRAGTAFQEPALVLVAECAPLPVAFLRVTVERDAAALAERAAAAIAERADLAPRFHSSFVNYGSEFDLVIAGDPAEFVDLIGQLAPAAKAAVAETFAALNEPQIVFELRRGVRWHDGQPFTAADVEFTFRALLDERVASPRRSDFELVRQLEPLDDHTVRVIYRKPYAPCLLSWGIGMLPRHILAGKDTAWWAEHFNRSPVGVGPFKFSRWKANQYIELRRNDDYYEGAPQLDTVMYRVIPDMVALRLLFETGEIDYWGVPAHAIESFLDNPRFDVFAREAPSFEYVGWNLRRPIFADARVRRALAHAVNVKAMIDYVYYGQGVQSTGPFPPQMWYCNPHVEPYGYDIERAKALLAEAGWQPGRDGILEKDGEQFTFTLITNHPNEVRKDIATLVQSDLAKVGIKVELQLYEWAVFISEYINKLDFDACVLGWSLGYDYDQYQLWHSSQAKPGMLNHVSYANPAADRLIELARSEFDEAQAREWLWEFNRIIYEDQPYLFLVVPRSTGAMHRGELAVKRPDGAGGWLEEPVRSAKIGFTIYREWWRRPALEP